MHRYGYSQEEFLNMTLSSILVIRRCIPQSKSNTIENSNGKDFHFPIIRHQD